MPLTPLADYLRSARGGQAAAPAGLTPLRDYFGQAANPLRRLPRAPTAASTAPAPRQPVASPGVSAPSGPLIPREASLGVGLARSVTPLLGQGGLRTGINTVSDLFNLGGGVLDLSRATTPTGTAAGALRTLSGGAGLVRDIAPNTAVGGVPVAGAASGVAGVGSGALNLARGNIPGGVTNLLTAAPSVANLFPAAATLGGVPISAAGAAEAGLAASEAGIGLGGGATLGGGGASLAGAAGALAIPAVAGIAVENIVNAILGEGPFGPTPLPFTNRGASNWLSSADNAASQISAMRGLQGATQLQGVIQQAEDPGQLLGLALAGPGLSPHGELQFYMVGPQGETLSGGKGGVQQEPTNPAYDALVRRAAQGDPQALREFISRVRIQSGESGAATDNYLLTDWYRRKLVSLLPETHPVRQDTTGLFEPTPTAYGPTGRAQAYLDAISQLNEQYAPAGGPQYTAEDAIRGLMAGNVGHTTISQLFRPEGELIDRAAAERLVAANPAFQPRSVAPVVAERPWYETMYSSLQSGGYVSAPPGAPVPATIHGGEYVVPAGPLAERLHQESRWFLSPRRGLYQSPVIQDPRQDWSLVTLSPEEEDDPEPAGVMRLRAQGEHPIVVPDTLYERLGPGLEAEVERFRVQQYEAPAARQELMKGQGPAGSWPRLSPEEEEEIGAHRAGRGALIPLNQYLASASARSVPVYGFEPQNHPQSILDERLYRERKPDLPVPWNVAGSGRSIAGVLG